MIKKHLFPVILILLTFVSGAFAQKGTLRGKVIDEKGELLIGASILVIGENTGTITDFDGKYSLDLNPGTYTIAVSFISYQTKNISNVKISPGEVTIVDAKLSSAVIDIGTVEVTAKAKTNTENALLVMQKKSATVLDGISAEQISRLSDGTAAAALKRVTGVTVQGGKYVYVRGLGDRYSQIVLNGAEIPSLDPDKNTVQMDLFPSNIIENMKINKTMSPDIPGSSTGGLVNVITKDFPERFTFQYSSSFGYNPQANLIDHFLSYEGGKYDWLGIDDGTRDIPDEIQEELDVPGTEGINYIRYASDFDKLGSLTSSLNDIWEPETKMSFLNHSHKVAVGDQTKFIGKTFGYNMAFSYSQKYEFYKDGEFVLYDEENPVPWQIINTEYGSERGDERGTEDVKLAALLNLNIKLSNNHKLGFIFLRNQGGEKMARFRDGYFSYDDMFIERRNLAFIERAFNSSQLHGKHVIQGWNNSTIDWRSSYTHSKQDEPDLRFFVNFYDTCATGLNYKMKTNEVPARFYREMGESNFDNKVNFEYPFTFLGAKSKIKAGGSYVYKHRVSDENKISIAKNNETYDGDIAAFLDKTVSDTNQLGIYMKVDAVRDLFSSYEATSSVGAGYAMIDIPVGEKLRLVTGLRTEYSNIFVETKVDESNDNYDKGELEELDFLPSLNLTYSMKDDMNFRAAVSQSLARPVFKEIAPYSYYDYKVGIRKTGNPDLERATIINTDLRWEYFFKPGEIISVSLFYKYFNNPIEQKMAPEAENFEIVFINTKNSYLYGFEAEFRKKLGFVEVLKNFFVGANYTYVKSIVEIPQDVLDEIHITDPDREDTREMFGQAPYVVNAYLGYENDSIGLNCNIGFNVSGEKLLVVTQGGTPYGTLFPYTTLFRSCV